MIQACHILQSLRVFWEFPDEFHFLKFFSTKRTKSFCCVIFETINYLAWDETAIYCVYNFRNPTLIHRGVFLFLLFFETLNCLAWDETAKLEHYFLILNYVRFLITVLHWLLLFFSESWNEMSLPSVLQHLDFHFGFLDTGFSILDSGALASILWIVTSAFGTSDSVFGLRLQFFRLRLQLQDLSSSFSPLTFFGLSHLASAFYTLL